MNPVKALENHGQAVWLDFLARGFVAKGDLKKLIDTDGVKGVTSNPAIFEKAIGSSDEYDASISKALKAFHAASANPDISKRVGQFSRTGMEMAACGNTMKSQNVTVSELLPGFVAADKGGVVRIAELQSQGYLYLRP